MKVALFVLLVAALVGTEIVGSSGHVIPAVILGAIATIVALLLALSYDKSPSTLEPQEPPPAGSGRGDPPTAISPMDGADGGGDSE